MEDMREKGKTSVGTHGRDISIMAASTLTTNEAPARCAPMSRPVPLPPPDPPPAEERDVAASARSATGLVAILARCGWSDCRMVGTNCRRLRRSSLDSLEKR